MTDQGGKTAEADYIETDHHGSVVMLSDGGAVGLDTGDGDGKAVLTVYKTGSYDAGTGAVSLSHDSEWAALSRDEAHKVAVMLALFAGEVTEL
jgi:alpha-D-ribose 1-methylphosphonate 5-triphosphate synthase subunit PhnL